MGGFGQDFDYPDDKLRVKRYVTLLDVLIVGALCAVLCFFIVGTTFKATYSLTGDRACLVQNGAETLATSDGFRYETKDFSYPMVMERVPGAEGSEYAKYWVLYGVSPERRESGQLREPANYDEFYEPVSLLRDDNGDSHPDVAYLFLKDKAMPLEVSLEGPSFISNGGCDYWRDPIVKFVNWSLSEHSWIPGHAYGHQWKSFLEKLSDFDIAPTDGVAENSELELLRARPTLLDESTATRVFELLSSSLSDAGLERDGHEDDENFWRQAPHMAFEVLRWSGFRVQMVKSPSKSIQVDGFQRPLKVTKEYQAPALMVSRNREGRDSAKLAVFDVILFNNWTSQDAWQRRTNLK
ncbi:hypothetical protein GW916_02260 [bacterium]|nr:hypothetical protein [bacterium]